MNQTLIEAFRAAHEEVTGKLDGLTRGNEVLTILRALHERVNRCCILVRDIPTMAPSTFDAEMCCLLRVAYDGALQALYMVHSPTEARARADEYRQFADAERAKFLNVAMQSKTQFAAAVRKAPNPQAEAHVIAKLGAAKAKFLDSRGKLFTNWYRTNLEELAKLLRYHEEYDFIIRRLHTAVHCTPLGTLYGSPVDNGLACLLSHILPARILAAAGRYAGMDVSEQTKAVFDAAMSPVISANVPDLTAGAKAKIL